MPQPSHRRFRLPQRESKLPSERDWERSTLLEPQPAARQPALVSDGGGLAFAPAALHASPQPLDPDDPAVAALLARLAGGPGAGAQPRARWRRGGAPVPAPDAGGLQGWRLLTRTDDEVLFGKGLPPALLTIAFRRDARRGGWVHAASSSARPLRAARDGIRASSWRLDPSRPPQPQDTLLRVLVTEQTFSGGQRADRRLLTPDLYADEHRLILTVFVTPREGYQAGSSNPETPARVALPEPVGLRRLIDGALVHFSAREVAPEP